MILRLRKDTSWPCFSEGINKPREPPPYSGPVLVYDPIPFSRDIIIPPSIHTLPHKTPSLHGLHYLGKWTVTTIKIQLFYILIQ